MKKVVLVSAMMLAAVVGMAQNKKQPKGKNIQTVVVTTQPQMHCENCEKKIKDNLRFEKGVKEIETNIEAQRVTVTYDASKTNVDNIIKGFDKFGYKATEVKDNTTKKTADENKQK